MLLKRRIPPALALWLTAPIFGELFSGSSPLNEFINPVTFLTLALLYGCGAILARELVIRWNKGWPSLLVLGFAYGIYEEGLLVQSFFDPSWMDLGSLAVYGRVAGVNWVWTQHLTIYHALISICASVAFVEIVYPERRGQSWAGGRWWWANWAGFLGIYLVWEAMTTYNAGVWKPITWLAVVGLCVLARALPKPAIGAAIPVAAPAWRYWWVGFLGMLGHFFLIYTGPDQGAYPFGVAMVLIAGFDGLCLWLVLRWNRRGAAWDDRHRLALINGALSFFLILTPLTIGSQYPVLYFSNPVFLAGLWLTAWWVARRPAPGMRAGS
jgi:hypothetical protein